MLSIQRIIEIAAKYFTSMADAMISACINRATETGEPLNIPERRQPVRRSKRTPLSPEDVDWQRMVKENTDTRQHHM